MPRTYHPDAGTHIDDATVAACDLARKSGIARVMKFNGVELTVLPDSVPRDLQQRYHDESQRQAEEYRRSPAGIAQAEKMRANTIQCQGVVDRCLKCLPEILATENLATILWWCRAFAYAADEAGTKFDKMAVIGAFEAAGYRRDEFVGKGDELNNETKDGRYKTARYIIGQIISCLCNAMPPHQITITFIDRWFKPRMSLNPKTMADGHDDVREPPNV